MMTELKKCYGGLIRVKKLPIQHVLEQFTIPNGKKHKLTFDGVEYIVKPNSPRYILFKEKGLTCVSCGKTANSCFLEYAPGTEPTAHFNFYYVEKGFQDLLFTKDHIIPKSLGGKDHQDNYQPMCMTCNNIKDSKIE